jgi:hypothetical protein
VFRTEEKNADFELFCFKQCRFEINILESNLDLVLEEEKDLEEKPFQIESACLLMVERKKWI